MEVEEGQRLIINSTNYFAKFETLHQNLLQIMNHLQTYEYIQAYLVDKLLKLKNLSLKYILHFKYKLRSDLAALKILSLL